MSIRYLVILVSGCFLISGCSNTGRYPITGMEVGINDQVQFMSAPNVTR